MQFTRCGLLHNVRDGRVNRTVRVTSMIVDGFQGLLEILNPERREHRVCAHLPDALEAVCRFEINLFAERPHEKAGSFLDADPNENISVEVDLLEFKNSYLIARVTH